MNVEKYFPKEFSIRYVSPVYDDIVNFMMWKGVNSTSWEGYHKGHRISLFYNDYYWIVQVYKSGTVVMSARHIEDNPSTGDLQYLVRTGCYLIDQFENK